MEKQSAGSAFLQKRWLLVLLVMLSVTTAIAFIIRASLDSCDRHFDVGAEKPVHMVPQGEATPSPLSFMKSKLVLLVSHKLSLSGALNGVAMEIPPLEEVKHSFLLYFLVPGEYTLLAAAVIDDANDILRAHSRTQAPDEPIFCRGPHFHVRVIGTV